jgi:hypothetical protein
VGVLLYLDDPKWFVHLAVDADAVYFTDPHGPSVVVRVPKCGGIAEPLASLPDERGNNPSSLSVVAGNVAWINLIGVGGEVLVAPVEPGGAARLLASTTQPLSDSIGLDAQSAYFGDGALERVSLAGGAPEPLVPGWLGVAAVDDARVYFDESPPTGSALGSVAKTGGPAATLAPVSSLGPYAQDEGAIYWLDWHDQGTGSSVVRVPKGGGSVEVLVGGQDAPYGIGVDDTHVYWAVGDAVGATQALRRAPKDGGAPEPVADGPVGAFTLDQRSVYWSTGHALMRLDK